MAHLSLTNRGIHSISYHALIVSPSAYRSLYAVVAGS